MEEIKKIKKYYLIKWNQELNVFEYYSDFHKKFFLDKKLGTEFDNINTVSSMMIKLEKVNEGLAISFKKIKLK